MINRKLSIAMFAATGLALPAISEAGNARVPQTVKMIASSPSNFAPITTPDTTNQIPGRLRRTDENRRYVEMLGQDAYDRLTYYERWTATGSLNYAINSSITFPCTSVSRKSRPA